MKKIPVACGVLFGVLMAVIVCSAETTAQKTTTILIEAESAARDSSQEATAQGWVAKELADASGGRVLFEQARVRVESQPIAVAIPRAGRYRVWVRYFRAAPTSPGFFVLFRDEEGEELAFHFCDWYTSMPTETPYEKPTPWASDRTGFVWEPFDATFERPVKASLVFGSYMTGGVKYGGGFTDRQADCLVVTTDRSFDPQALEIASLPSLVTSSDETKVAPPPGFVVSKGLPATADFFSGIDDPHQRFQAGLINNGSYFLDIARAVRLGFNRDHAKPSAELMRHGVLTQGHVESFSGDRVELQRAYKSPTGRFVNAEGKVGNAFSFNFPPVAKSTASAIERRLAEYLNDDYVASVGDWRISDESGGLLDYSTSAQGAFRAWLAKKHKTIATLNERWGTNYSAFDKIVPPARFEDGTAAWLEFRDFSGESYAAAIAWQLPIIRKLDPRHRPMVGANSNLDFFAPYFTRIRPIDFAEFARDTLSAEKFISWDTYCADDQLGCEIDLVRSFGNGKKPIVQEWSNHAVDPRIAARSYWTMVSKGAAGVFLFMFQEGFHPQYPKWSLLDERRAPKDKLAAYSDAAQEVHRLEPLLMSAQPIAAVKPVAMYWSRIDLSLAEPHESLYGCALDSPFHIYGTLRSLGYPVRWISPGQIEADELRDVGALVLADCNHIPRAAAAKIEAWVKRGGVVIGDQWPGAWDEYARDQTTLAGVFGVRLAATAKKKGTESNLALQESKQGYGEVTDAAIVRKTHYEKVEEMSQQPGATHPVALEVGPFMLSGIGLDRVECVAGHVIGMTHGGVPGLVINDYGRGNALYSSILLGTIYESGGTRYEWNTTQAGLSYGHILDAFLKHSGVTPSCTVSGLAERVRAKVRVESPLVTPAGNMLVGLTSMNDDRVGPFDLEVQLPQGAAGPFVQVLVAVQGNRRLEVVDATVDESRLMLRMPAFDTHATIVALKDSPPLVGLRFDDVEVGRAALISIGTDQMFEITATMYNPSPRTVAPGELALAIPAGWFQSAETLSVDAVPAGGSASASFRVRPPSIAAGKALRPLSVRYRNEAVKSTPATEMVWWGM